VFFIKTNLKQSLLKASLSHTSPLGMLTTPRAQGRHQGVTSNLYHAW
jgi:hypothetical protein